MVMSLMRSIMMKNYSVYVAHIEFDEVPEPKVKMLISRSFSWKISIRLNSLCCAYLLSNV